MVHNFGYDKTKIIFVVTRNQCENIAEVFDNLTSDDQGKFRHFFLPDLFDKNFNQIPTKNYDNETCIICEGDRKMHHYNDNSDI